jgi:putative MATE family efflux protein
MLFRDREYYTTLVKIALPIAIQNFISSALNAVGVLLIGQLGDTAVAAVGLANQIFFLLNLMLFGIVSGAAIFTAQLWGKGDRDAIRKVTGLCLCLALAAGLIFTLVALVFPGPALNLYSNDPSVIEQGARYLKIIGLSYLATGVSFALAGQLRATGNVRTPMLVSVVALGMGTVLNYLLIFGEFGLPALGVEGAALGTCLARLLECAAMLAVTYLGRLPVAFRPSDLRGLTWPFARRLLSTVLPVTANETIWSLGYSIYNVVYAHISTEAIAAINITSTVEGLANFAFIAFANAAAIMIGNQIGAGQEQKAFQYARRSIILCAALGAVVGLLLILFSASIVSNYKVSELTAVNLRAILIVLGCAFWMRVCNMTLIVGVLRSGGDTRFSFILDVGTVWLVGIPMALLGAFALHLPVYWVYLMVISEEFVKFLIGLTRFVSRKWINDVTEAVVV